MKSGKSLFQRIAVENDFSPVLKTAVKEKFYADEKEAKNILIAFLQWFSLIPGLKTGERLQMLKGVDPIWHAFVLNTKYYREFCTKYIGFFVDHDPLDADDFDLPKTEYAAFTLQLLKKEYGSDLHEKLQLLEEGATCCMGCSSRTFAFEKTEMVFS